MSRDVSTYDDAFEVGNYLRHNFPELLTENERRAFRTFWGEGKASVVSSESIRRKLHADTSSRGIPEVDELLNLGWDRFWRTVAERVLCERGVDFLLLRCPRCQRVVATPRARQCLWCGHDWHGCK